MCNIEQDQIIILLIALKHDYNLKPHNYDLRGERKRSQIQTSKLFFKVYLFYLSLSATRFQAKQEPGTSVLFAELRIIMSSTL